MLGYTPTNAASAPPALGFQPGVSLRGRAGSSSISHKKRTHVLSYGGHHTKGHPTPLCTKTRCLIFLFLLVLCAFIWSEHTRASNGQVDKLRELREQINQHNVNHGVGVVSQLDEAGAIQEVHLDGNTPVPAGDDPQLVQTKATLSRALIDLENSQSSVKRLSEELEQMRSKLERRPVGVEAPASTSGARPLATPYGPIEVPGYPPIAIAASKKYTKFFCIGGRGRLGAQNDRSCRFQNICYKPSTNQWQFFQDPSEKLVVLLDQGKIIDEFPEEFLNLRSMGNPQDAKWWAPTIVKTPEGIPEAAFVPRANPDTPTVNVLYHPHYPSNMGHVIGDDLFPIFNLMSSFGMLVTDAQLIISRDCGKIFAGQPKKAEQCDFFLNMLLPGVTSRKYLAATEDAFVTKARGGVDAAGAPQDLVCFEQMLVGNGPWGFQQSLGKAPSWWSYHAFYLSNLGVNPNRTPKKPRITVSIKKGKRALANNDELVEHLRKTFPTYEIDALELRSLGGWKAELEYLLDTSILITPCGGVSMSAMFLPHNAALIVVDYYNLRKQVSFGMEERLWSNLGYVRPFHYPFTFDEVEMPEGHKRDDYQEVRDWGQVRVNMERMTTIVRAAMQHTENFMVYGQS